MGALPERTWQRFRRNFDSVQPREFLRNEEADHKVGGDCERCSPLRGSKRTNRTAEPIEALRYARTGYRYATYRNKILQAGAFAL